MEKIVQQDEVTAAPEKKRNGLYVASLNREMIKEDAAGVQYSCRNIETPDYSQVENPSDDNWMPAVLSPEEEKALFDEYY